MCSDKRCGMGGDEPSLSEILAPLMVCLVVMIAVLVLVGCSSVPQKQPVCPAVPVCDYKAYDDMGDRLEDALRDADRELRACEREFHRYQIKSGR